MSTLNQTLKPLATAGETSILGKLGFDELKGREGQRNSFSFGRVLIKKKILCNHVDPTLLVNTPPTLQKLNACDFDFLRALSLGLSQTKRCFQVELCLQMTHTCS